MADDAVRADWVDATPLEGVPPGAVIGCTVRGHEIALCRLDDGTVHAVGNVCTHEHARLSDGWLIGDVLACPFHGGQFDVRTGAGVCGPVERPLPVYEVRLRDGLLGVRLPPVATATGDDGPAD